MANSDILELSEDGKTVIGVKDRWSVKSITIPDGVTEIGKSAFNGCRSLQSINVSKDNKHFASVDGILFNKDLTIIVRFPEQYDVTEYVIPNSVTEIGNRAFYDCRSLQNIDIPNSVTEIGPEAFSCCSSLQSIDIPYSVTKIGDFAFYGCSSLQSINVSKDNKHFASVDGILFNKDLTTIGRFPQKYDVKEYVIPNSVTVIGYGTFEGCSSLQSIDIPNSVTEIGPGAFFNCSSLQSIDIPNSVTEILRSTFSCCSSLQSIDIPKSVTEIGLEAFACCSSLQSIDIPNSVAEIEDKAFWRCSSLQSIDIPNSVTEIGRSTFSCCSSLQSIDIPNSVTVIGNNAFKFCSSLQSIDVSNDNMHFASVNGILFNKDLTIIVRFPEQYDVTEYVIPKSVTEIGDEAFENCSSLQRIDIPDSVTKIGDSAFSGCSSLQSIDIPDSVTEIGDRTFGYCSSLQRIDIPDSVTKIGNEAFMGCKSLQRIDIPNSVTVIGGQAFGFCSSLQSINVSKDNKHFASVDGILFDKDLTAIVRLPPKYDVKEYVIPNSVTKIEYWAFEGCSSFQSIDIPDSVTEISTWAFDDCSSLEHIYFHCNDVEKLTLGDSIFHGVNFDKCILHIPSGTRWAYRHHDVFKRFKNIVTTGF